MVMAPSGRRHGHPAMVARFTAAAEHQGRLSGMQRPHISPPRQVLLEHLAAEADALPADPRVRIGIGIGEASKSVLAGELTAMLTAAVDLRVSGPPGGRGR